MSRRILHICDNLYYGGAQTVMITTINALPEFEHFVVYLAKYEELKPAVRCPCYYIEQKKGLRIIQTIWAVYRFVKKNDIDLVHCNVFNSMIIGRIVAMFRPGLAQVTTYHGMSYLSSLPNSKKWALVDRLVYMKRFVNIAVSETVKKHIHEKISRRREVFVVTNSVDQQFFSAGQMQYPAPGSVLRFVTVANNFPLKNIRYLVELFSRLQPEHFELHIYGGRMEALQQEITSTAKGNIFFYGIRPISGVLLRQYDVYISASLTEGCPLSVMEAMAAGMPVVLSGIDAHREITGGRGFFFDPHDITSGASKVKYIYENRSDLTGMSEMNVQLSKKFTPAIFAAKIKNIYLEQFEQE